VIDFTCKVDDRALIKQLEQLGPKCKPILRKALRPLAAEVKKAVKPLAPKRTGALRKSLAVVPIKSRRFYTIGFRIFSRYKSTDGGKPKAYAFAPEYGVKKGRGVQPGREFFKKGAAIAAAYVPRCKQAIADAIAAAFNK
jgi:hypothetical protein